MPNLATISTSNSSVTGKLVMTTYGLKRILERIQNADTFTPFNLAKIGVGSKMVTTYDSSVTALRNEILTFDINPEDIIVNGNTCTIKCDLSIDDGVAMQELGIYEVIKGRRYLFAYASGFSMIVNESLSYTLVIDLALHLAFKDVDYPRYPVGVGEVEYAMHPDIMSMYNALSNVQLDLERCIQANANKLGFNKAEVFYKTRKELSEQIRTTLLFNRYQKLASKFKTEDMSDCFYFPEVEQENYSVRNLCDETSRIGVAGLLAKANRDNVDFSGPATIIWSGIINDLDTVGVLFGKIDPDNDRYYFDFRITDEDVQDRPIKGKSGEFPFVPHIKVSEVIINSEEDIPAKFVTLDVASISEIGNLDKLSGCTYYYIPTVNKYYYAAVPDVTDGKLYWVNVPYDNYQLRKNNTFYQINDCVNVPGDILDEDENLKKFSFQVHEIIHEKFLQFTIYSYNYKLASRVDSHLASEFDVVGHYRLKCYLTDELRQIILGKECAYSFVFNGDEENPQVDFYINTTKINAIVDNFNFSIFPTFKYLYDKIIFDEVEDKDDESDYTYIDDLHTMDYSLTVNIDGQEVPVIDLIPKDYVDKEFLKRIKHTGDLYWAQYAIEAHYYEVLQRACTLRNFTSFTETIPYTTPVEYGGSNIVSYENKLYYVLPDVETISFIAFKKALTEDEIQYIALISQA